MNVDRYLRMIAGLLRDAERRARPSRCDLRWFYFTAFVGLNLFQSAFTNWCPMITFLKKLGVRSA